MHRLRAASKHSCRRLCHRRTLPHCCCRYYDSFVEKVRAASSSCSGSGGGSVLQHSVQRRLCMVDRVRQPTA